MNCATYPWRMKLAHSATIPCVSQMLSTTPNGSSAGGGESQEGDSAANTKTGPDGLNRSLSFDGRRQVWARVEAHWARVTLDRDRFVPATGYSVVKYDPQGEQPFYQRIRSWLTSNPQTQTYQQSPVMTKVLLTTTTTTTTTTITSYPLLSYIKQTDRYFPNCFGELPVLIFLYFLLSTD